MLLEDLQVIPNIVWTWVEIHGLKIIATFIVTWLILRFLNRIITRVVRKLVPRGAFVFASEERKREDTLINILRGFLSIFVWLVAIFILLDSFGVPIGPLLTGAGILGVAVGFGSQALVKDIINGIFIIAENQFRIGDVIQVEGIEGTVEGMTLRVTRIRQLNGTIHYVPNGEIKIASNRSKDYSMVDLTIDVGYDSKIDHVKQVVNEVGKNLREDPEFTDKIIDAPQFLRVQDLSDSSIQIRILGKVYPKEQYDVAGELRKRLKRAFEQNEITIPYPTRIVYSTPLHKEEL